jgi:hypothetical protein
MYKEASKLKLRFQTTKGELTTEQLWDLSLQELDALAVSLEGEYKKSGKKSFLDKKSEKDKVIKLKFNIVVDILTTKVEAVEVSQKEVERKEHNEKILRLIKAKQDSELEDKSVEELTAMLK